MKLEKMQSIEDTVIAQLQIIKDIRSKQARLDDFIKMLAAKIETKDFFSIAGYASLRGLMVDVSKANLIGRKAIMVSRDNGIEIGKVIDPELGQVNTYHLDVLKEVFR